METKHKRALVVVGGAGAAYLLLTRGGDAIQKFGGGSVGLGGGVGGDDTGDVYDLIPDMVQPFIKPVIEPFIPAPAPPGSARSKKVFRSAPAPTATVAGITAAPTTYSGMADLGSGVSFLRASITGGNGGSGGSVVSPPTKLAPLSIWGSILNLFGVGDLSKSGSTPTSTKKESTVSGTLSQYGPLAPGKIDFSKPLVIYGSGGRSSSSRSRGGSSGGSTKKDSTTKRYRDGRGGYTDSPGQPD